MRPEDITKKAIVFYPFIIRKDDSAQQNPSFKRQSVELVETGEIFDACSIPDILMINP